MRFLNAVFLSAVLLSAAVPEKYRRHHVPRQGITIYTDTLVTHKSDITATEHTAGCSILCPSIEFRLFRKNGEPVRSGLSLPLSHISGIPLTVSAGMLSYTGSAAYFRHPGSRMLKKQQGIQVRLPFLHSREQPLSLAVDFSPPPFRSVFAFTGDSGFLWSAGGTADTENIRFTFTLSGCRFHLKPHKERSWYRSSPVFSPHWYNAGIAEAAAETAYIRTAFAAGIYQNPVSDVRAWVQNQEELTTGNITYTLSLFAADSFFMQDTRLCKIICTDGKELHTPANASLAVQYSDRHLCTKARISVKQKTSAKGALYPEGKAGFHFRYHTKQYTLQAGYTMSHTGTGGTDSHICTAAVARNFFSAKLKTSVQCTFLPDCTVRQYSVRTGAYDAVFPGLSVFFYIKGNSSNMPVSAAGGTVCFKYAYSRVKYRGKFRTVQRF